MVTRLLIMKASILIVTARIQHIGLYLVEYIHKIEYVDFILLFQSDRRFVPFHVIHSTFGQSKSGVCTSSFI